MSRRIAAALTALAVLTVAGVALATPGSGITPTTHVNRNTLADPVQINDARIKFQTKGAVDTRVQTLTFAPGATTGWHSHPGFVLISVTQGTLTLYGSDCAPHTYSAGQTFTETDDPIVVRNETADQATTVVTWVVPEGGAFRVDQPNPGCQVN